MELPSSIKVMFVRNSPAGLTTFARTWTYNLLPFSFPKISRQNAFYHLIICDHTCLRACYTSPIDGRLGYCTCPQSTNHTWVEEWQVIQHAVMSLSCIHSTASASAWSMWVRLNTVPPRHSDIVSYDMQSLTSWFFIVASTSGPDGKHWNDYQHK